MDKKIEIIPAGQFKQQCLALIDQVATSGTPIVISKRGKPMVRLVPLESEPEIEERILTRLRSGEGGMLVDEESFLRPSSDLADWTDL